MIWHFRRTLRRTGLLIALAVPLVHADPLEGTSPFLPAGGAAATAPTQDAALELRGIMATGDETMFSIYDASRRSSVWKRLNEPGHEFVIRSYDSAGDAVTVEHQGKTLTLALRTAKVAAAPVNMPQTLPAVGAPPPGAQPIGGPVAMNPTPADEQRRLEAIAAEVNRRRMIRQQALQASRANAGQAQPPGQPAANQRR